MQIMTDKQLEKASNDTNFAEILSIKYQQHLADAKEQFDRIHTDKLSSRYYLNNYYICDQKKLLELFFEYKNYASTSAEKSKLTKIINENKYDRFINYLFVVNELDQKVIKRFYSAQDLARWKLTIEVEYIILRGF